jgi:rhodanese-related sulfurtransferase
MNRIIIDVREPYEYSKGHVEGALNIPPATIMRGVPKELEKVPRDTELVLYCLSGSRSRASMHFLQAYGFTNLINGVNKEQVKARYGR